MRYKRILMDIDDTLFDFMPGNRNAVSLLMKELDLDAPGVFEEYQAINHACWEALERGEMNQSQLHVERFRRFLALKNSSADPEAVAARFAQLLGQQVIPLPHSEEMVRAVAAERPVTLLTNGITVIQRARLAGSAIRNWIDKMIVSQEVGLSKPDPRIFALALEGLDPSEALMIGDGLNSDIRGANNAGIDVCWYNPKGKELPADMHVEYEVRDLLECIEIALQ